MSGTGKSLQLKSSLPTVQNSNMGIKYGVNPDRVVGAHNFPFQATIQHKAQAKGASVIIRNYMNFKSVKLSIFGDLPILSICLKKYWF